MLDMLLPLTPMDMLHMLDTPMLLDMLVPMVLTLMLELMVPTTLARGLLMLSLRLRLMLSMVPMDILHMLRPMLMDILLLLMPMDTLDMPDMLDTLMPPMVLMVPTLTWDKKKLLISNLHQEKSIYFPPKNQDKNVNEFQLQDLTHSQWLSFQCYSLEFVGKM